MSDDIMEVDQQVLGVAQMEASVLRCVCLLDSALGRPFRTVEDMGDDEMGGYRSALLRVIEYAEQHEAETMDLGTLAELAWRTFLESVGQPAPDFAAVHGAIREKWRFFVRHVWNLLGYDASEDGAVQEHEARIEASFKQVLEVQGLISKG